MELALLSKILSVSSAVDGAPSASVRCVARTDRSVKKIYSMDSKSVLLLLRLFRVRVRHLIRALLGVPRVV
jgi:hypothetical protein